MKNRFIILGCGSSLGSPWITNYWGNLKKNYKNIRTRCCAHISINGLSILIDTSPDIKKQIIDNKIKNIDAILYTHEHADQTSGIFELRPFFWKNKKRIDVYANSRTVKSLHNKYTFCFFPRHGYQPIMKSHVISNLFRIKKGTREVEIRAFDVKHGLINSSGFLINKLAYISDCSHVPRKSIKFLQGLNYLIIDCLRMKKHPSHFCLSDALELIKKTKPRRAVLTNLHVDLDYSFLKKKLPSQIMPAYDGLKLHF